ncbi:MAG: non-heme iron oxygenase ferredoxin subunit [Ilumatobacteraceae bacterium]|jgi:3-phenylpropionate/trans-cinnamate dioxygenase ferredoxin subunit
MSRVCRLDDLVDGQARRFDVDGVPVAVVRVGDDVHAVHDTCSHADVSLSEGIVWCETLQIECIRHGSAFNLVTGRPDTLPATQPVAVYAASIVDGEVDVDITHELNKN